MSDRPATKRTKITRKKFLVTAIAGFAGIKLMPKTINGNLSYILDRRKVGKI